MSNASSIEWIIKQLIFKIEFENLPIQYVLMSDKDIDSIIEQAKAMHKEEHHKTYNQGLMSNFQTFEHYYEQTFGGNNEQQ